jgi:hypothetical protein
VTKGIRKQKQCRLRVSLKKRTRGQIQKCHSSGCRVKLTPLPKLKQPSRDPLVHKQACVDPVDHFTSLGAYDLPSYKVAGTIPVSLGPPDESDALSKLESWKGASSLVAAAEAIYGPSPSMPAHPNPPKTKTLAVVHGCKQQIEIQALLEEEGEKNARMEALRRMGATLNAQETMAAKMEQEHLRTEEKETVEVCVSVCVCVCVCARARARGRIEQMYQRINIKQRGYRSLRAKLYRRP